MSIIMSNEIKMFWNFSDLTSQEKIDLSKFTHLNETIEKNNEFDNYRAVYSAYVSGMLNIWEDEQNLVWCSELDYQIKYLIDKLWLTNGILLFAEKKYQKLDTAIWELLVSHDILYQEEEKEYLEIINSIKKWIFSIEILDCFGNYIDSCELMFNIEWDIISEYEKFKNGLLKFDIARFKKENKIIDIICWIKKQ